MTRKKRTDLSPDAPADLPPDTPQTLTETNHLGDQPETTPETQKPIKTFSYPVARDTFIQASVWEKVVTLKGGDTFTTHEVNVRKRYKNGNEEWKTALYFRCSELYALTHAIEKAEAFILDLRGDCPF